MIRLDRELATGPEVGGGRERREAVAKTVVVAPEEEAPTVVVKAVGGDGIELSLSSL